MLFREFKLKAIAGQRVPAHQVENLVPEAHVAHALQLLTDGLGLFFAERSSLLRLFFRFLRFLLS